MMDINAGIDTAPEAWKPPPPDAIRQGRFAISLSLAFGLMLLVGKAAAYWMTGSAAILSDVSESVIHLVAIAFAAFSIWLSTRPADHRFLYGYERVVFFSTGFEGAVIIVAAIYIIVAAIQKWLAGLRLERLGAATLIIAAIALVNAGLGWYLVKTGRRTGSLILEANGKHILADSWTSFGVVAGLVLVLVTGWLPFDPLVAIAVAVNILWTGGKLVWRSVGGLMDYSDPVTTAALRKQLDALTTELGLGYHNLRFRNTGYRLSIELHLLFPYDTPVGEAHRRATTLERRLTEILGVPASVVTHLEALEDHSRIHPEDSS